MLVAGGGVLHINMYVWNLVLRWYILCISLLHNSDRRQIFIYGKEFISPFVRCTCFALIVVERKSYFSTSASSSDSLLVAHRRQFELLLSPRAPNKRHIQLRVLLSWMRMINVRFFFRNAKVIIMTTSWINDCAIFVHFSHHVRVRVGQGLTAPTLLLHFITPCLLFTLNKNS